MTLQAIGDALAVALDAVEGLERVYVWRPDHVAPPCIVVETPEEWLYDQTFGSPTLTRWGMVLTVIVARADAVLGGEQLAAYIDAGGPRSVRAALEADPTLGGVCDTVLVNPDGRAANQSGTATIAGIDYLVVRLRFDVWERSAA
jgi:hypothetical protein